MRARLGIGPGRIVLVSELGLGYRVGDSRGYTVNAAVIDARGSSRGLLLGAALSGALSYLAAILPEPYVDLGLTWGAGFFFGVLVLAPRARSWWRRAALVLASTLIYRGAVWFATELVVEASWSELLACLAAGTLAAPLLRLATRPLLGDRSSMGGRLLALAAGAAGGALIGVAIAAPDGELLRLHLPLLAGFLTWQVGYAWAYGSSR